jgi:hypothetical protein
MKALVIFVFCNFIIILSFSQNITGKVTNAKNGEPLEFVSIGIIDNKSPSFFLTVQ